MSSREIQHEPGPVSQLLVRWSDGDPSALAELTPVVYNELRRLARSSLQRGPEVSVLQPTALVHEVWLRLAAKAHLSLETRGQFYALTAKVMRDLLVDRARRRQAAKRGGGGQVEVTLEDANASEQPRQVDLLVLDEAMTRLGRIKPRYTQVVELRYLAGLTIDETAAALNVSPATIQREWEFARAWLRRELDTLRAGRKGRSP
jgi:RNA polymerase sigma factor (TIGR02999 family)